MTNIDAYSHLRGESIYLDDIPPIQGTLFAAALGSPVAHGFIKNLDVTDAVTMPGVIRIFTYKDITGENQIGGIVADEPLLADTHVHFCGMPIALVIAETVDAARAALKQIKLSIELLPIITDARQAQAANEMIVAPRHFKLGDIDNSWQYCKYIFEGRTDTNGQEHLYIETQGAYAIPQENNSIKIFSSTQAPTAVQKAVSKVLGVPMHQVEVEVNRLGGGFGGKEDQANTWATLCALAAHLVKRPVKYALHRMEDMAMTGKRHPYSSDFKIGLNEALQIIAYEVTFYQNAGAAADLSPAVLERSLFHCTNSYFIPNVKATAYSCRTNLPPNTAFRGFGGPQGMFVIEAAIAKAAEALSIDASVIQKKNLLKTGDEFPYGQIVESEAVACWEKATMQLATIQKEIELFNATDKWFRKGVACMPICFGISFTKTFMNQARSLVHIYTDGSVSITTSAVEMGQGVNTKILQVAATVFSIPPTNIKIQSTNTNKIANTSPSAASSTADLNGKATLMACTAIANRLKKMVADELQVDTNLVTLQDGYVWVNGEKTNQDWKELIATAHLKRIGLSEHAHYVTPEIHFDAAKEKGHPFAYHVFGTAIIITTVDCLRGTYTMDAVKVVHDAGASMNLKVDLGQIEGGIVQGIGWMTMEEVVYDDQGRLRSNALSTYKVPDIYSVPKEITIDFLQTAQDNLAVFRSKAVGEPPLMYGIGAYFSLRNAIKAFNKDAVISFDAPMTPEKVLLALYANQQQGRSHEQSINHLATDQ